MTWTRAMVFANVIVAVIVIVGEDQGASRVRVLTLVLILGVGSKEYHALFGRPRMIQWLGGGRERRIGEMKKREKSEASAGKVCGRERRKIKGCWEGKKRGVYKFV